MNAYTIDVGLVNRTYPIVIAPDIATRVVQYVLGKSVMIVTNTTVASHYLKNIKACLDEASKKVHTFILPDGEVFKTMESVIQIWDSLLQNKCDRHTTLIALGGGVIGDVTGFAAACFMRGIPFIQMPTTLLAQVDSSVGGKTGVNHPLGKNMIGAFYQPQAVLADMLFLETLPEREFISGLAEVIKYGAILDKDFFLWIEKNTASLLKKDHAALGYAIKRSCEIKAQVVKLDEREENGLRAKLNFGHTFGHAIEGALGYGLWLHGEAVGCGMVLAAQLSHHLGYISETEKNYIVSVIKQLGLPITPPRFTWDTWIKWIQLDKKNEAGKLKCIVLHSIGESVVENVPSHILQETLLACEAIDNAS